MSDSKWSSETLGWGIFFTDRRPAGIENIPKEGRAEAVKQHYEGLFERLKLRISETGGRVRIVSMQEFIGSACIVGDDASCRLLKQEFERSQFATMIKNEVCIRAG